MPPPPPRGPKRTRAGGDPGEGRAGRGGFNHRTFEDTGHGGTELWSQAREFKSKTSYASARDFGIISMIKINHPGPASTAGEKVPGDAEGAAKAGATAWRGRPLSKPPPASSHRSSSGSPRNLTKQRKTEKRKKRPRRRAARRCRVLPPVSPTRRAGPCGNWGAGEPVVGFQGSPRGRVQPAAWEQLWNDSVDDDLASPESRVGSTPRCHHGWENPRQ